MKTLTITDAKKNLGTVARRRGPGRRCRHRLRLRYRCAQEGRVESTDYAQREYGVLPDQVAALEKATDQRYRRVKRSKKLLSVSPGELRKVLE